MRATIHNRDTDKFILLARRHSNHSGSKAGRSSHFVRGPPPDSFHARPPTWAHGTRNKSSPPCSSSSLTSIATSSAHPRLPCTSSRSVPSRNRSCLFDYEQPPEQPLVTHKKYSQVQQISYKLGKNYATPISMLGFLHNGMQDKKSTFQHD